jgi:hypothetical protein
MGAYVVLDSLPDQRFKAHVQKVNLMPDQGSRFSNPNLKVYSTEILIDDKLPDVKPGLSARAEIVITNLADVIKVPIQAVTTLKNKQVCYVRKGSEDAPSPVEVGLYNSKFIQITSGLQPGDLVLMSPPVDAGEVGLDKDLVSEGEDLPPTQVVKPDAAGKSPVAGQATGDRKGGKVGKSGTGGPGAGGRQPSPEMLQRFDKNGNGQIDEDERPAMSEYFRKRREKGGERAD